MKNVTLIWCAPALGIALTSKRWGKIADRYGQKAVFTFCISLKPLLLMSLFFITENNVLWAAPLVFFIDSFWNAGMMVAGNGYVLKMSPQENRAMFIAAVTAIAGICGGIGAMAGGAFLEAYRGFSLEFFGRTWTNYHLLFAVDIPLRIICVFMAFRVQDPKSKSSVHVFNYIRGTLRLTGIQVAAGFYRSVGRTINGIKYTVTGNGNGKPETDREPVRSTEKEKGK
jgi:MFS family permease